MSKPPFQTADRTDVRWVSVLNRFEKHILAFDDDAAGTMHEEGGETALARIGDTAFPVSISLEEERDGVVFVLGAFDGEEDEPFETRQYRWVRGTPVARIA